MIGCSGTERNSPAGNEMETPSAASAEGGPAAVAGTDEEVVLFLGTSLTAALGLREEDSFPTAIGEKIEEAGLPYRVVNAGVSGETSSGALRRLDWLLQQPFDVLVLETGANDMLRGTDPTVVEENIQTIIDRVRSQRPGTAIVLAGMLAAPNLGPRYVREFEAIYPRLAERNGLMLIPFLLDGVAGDPALNQGDGIHPTAEGQQIVADNVWEVLGPLLREEAAAE